MTPTLWRKSSQSVNDANCVEVRHTLDTVRDSKNTAGPTLHGDIRRLTQEIRNGRLDR
jgi:uncharacterized protein DUF397